MKATTVVKNETITCPRCEQQTIKTKDWGQAGMLFVHSEGVENGMPIQNACHVSRGELTNGLKWTVKR